MLNVTVVKIVTLFAKTKTRVRNVHDFRHIIMTDWRWGKRSNSSPSFLAAISRMRRLCPQSEPRHGQLKKMRSILSYMVRFRRFKSLYIMTIEKIRRYISDRANPPKYKHFRVLVAKNGKYNGLNCKTHD